MFDDNHLKKFSHLRKYRPPMPVNQALTDMLEYDRIHNTKPPATLNKAMVETIIEKWSKMFPTQEDFLVKLDKRMEKLNVLDKSL